MSAVVYYFSGTGNSFAVARDIARSLEGGLVPLASLMQRGRITPEADVVGIVFPVHNVVHDGLPPIVGRFVGKLDNLRSKYIFAVCTCGGGSAGTLHHLRRLLAARGGGLAAGFTVKMPMNLTPITPVAEQQRRFDRWKARREFIGSYVTARRHGRFEAIPPLVSSLLSPLFAPVKASLTKDFQRLAAANRPLAEIFPLMDRGFSSDARCNGCSICARVCPVDNIQMVSERPAWQHRCENCFACLAWCPNEAIRSGQVSAGDRYHHPEVDLADMLKRSGTAACAEVVDRTVKGQ